jgi:hypothetical protein
VLIIRGLEVTQAIQYYRSDQHLTNPTEQLPDNSVTLIANKPAWVRVYVESDSGQSVTNVTGTVTLNWGYLSVKAGQAPLVLNPQPPGSAVAQFNPDYKSTRAAIAATLNFVIPADQMLGPITLEASVSAPGVQGKVTKSISVSAKLRQTLKLRGVMLGYNGPDPNTPGQNLTIAAPTLADLQSTASWALRVMPVRSNAVFEVATTLTQTTPLAGTATNGGCTTAWLNLNAAVAQAKVADGSLAGYVYYGLMPSNYPNTSNVGGCESSGVSASTVGFQTGMAHEIGHACGLRHGPCGSVGTSADPNYPAYPPYDTAQSRTASIGEYGLDISTGDISTPESAKSYMSYCGPQWVSLYDYGILLNNDVLNQEQVGTTFPWWQYIVAYDPWWWLHYQPDPPWYVVDPGPIEEIPVIVQNVITVIGTIDSSERVEITSVTRSAVFDTTIAGVAGALTLRLHGAGDELLAAAPMIEVVGQGGCGCGCGGSDARCKDRGPTRPALIMAHLPDVGPGTRLSIQSGDRTVWERQAPRRPVQVGAPTIKRTDNMLAVTWTARWPRGATRQAWLRVSVDRGRTWKAVAIGLLENHTTLDPVQLPAGHLLLQVVAHDGFHSAYSASTELDNETLPPVPAILNPHPRRPLIAGETLHLWGSAAGQHALPSAETRFVWTIDGQQAGEGLEVYTTVPPAGTHSCSLAVLNEAGQVARHADITFESVALRRPAPPG